MNFGITRNEFSLLEVRGIVNDFVITAAFPLKPGARVFQQVSLENCCFFMICADVIKPVLMFIQRLSSVRTL